MFSFIQYNWTVLFPDVPVLVRVVKADSHVSESGQANVDHMSLMIIFFMAVFIRRAPLEDNTESECIRTVAATYGYRIVQLYECDAYVYGHDANCEWHPKNTSSCTALKTVDYRTEVFLHQYMF